MLQQTQQTGLKNNDILQFHNKFQKQKNLTGILQYSHEVQGNDLNMQNLQEQHRQSPIMIAQMNDLSALNIVQGQRPPALQNAQIPS